MGDKIIALKKEVEELQQEGKGSLELKLAKHNLEIRLLKEKEFWKIWARSNWLAYGDKSTKYFHHHASQRQKKNFIEGLMNGQGVMECEPEPIDEITVEYFQSLFSVTRPDRRYDEIFDQASFMPLMQNQQSSLVAPYEEKEVVEALL